ncbi:transposase [Noviherbaspirillum cavernae]|uniref:Transposase n=1 Tax=Noviherbaspirillum cavernae TaxID=2320862 RepID=A0A418X261_9BURK|nr:transposase [Noviherbaspirillum cavernae]RJG06557.1 transposase [Noviherbaspirillum cavernae]
MPNYRRATEGSSYFFTVVTHQRQRFLLDEDVRQALRAAIEQVRTIAPFRIDAFVLLPDHLHCIWTLPDGDTDYGMRWRLIKTFVTQACRHRVENPEYLSQRRASKGQSTLWQNRFWEHRLRDEADYARHVDYIHWNPVKHGFADRAMDWPYSSFHRFARNGIYPMDWGGDGVEGDLGE